ncbi:MAG: hypothetical protein FJY85_12875, partial [Deltaproteobacteria bacterium]|nr:hypothetical protein [Deltaproteobacteria bacterium]
MIDRTVLLSANLLEHVEPWQAVRILRHLKNNALGRWIVLTCPVTIDKDDHDLAARSPGTVSGEFTGLDHKCAPGVEMFLKLGPVGGSVVVAPGGYVVAF